MNRDPLVVFGAGGGCTAVHAHTAVTLEDFLYISVGNQLVGFDLKNMEMVWAQVVDGATCFGVYYNVKQDALICHGELAISRITTEGVIVWSSYGEDIFTGGLSLEPEFISVSDFNGRRYKLSYANGAEI